MTVTIRDVAKRAGVGVGTVSRVLNNNSNVSDSTREFVLSVIRELNFHPSPIAQRLSRQETRTIGVILPFFTLPFFVNILEGIHSVISDAGYDLIVMNVDSPEKAHRFLESAGSGRRFDGVIIVTLPVSDDIANLFRKNSVPVVLVDSYHPSICSVNVNNETGGYLATKHLIDNGYRSIAYIGDNQNDIFGFHTTQLRFNGYRKALSEAKIPYDPALVFHGKDGKGSGYFGAKHLFQMAKAPSAIFAFSDTVALGVYEAAKEAKKSIPDDLAVIGFDDIETSTYISLSTVRQPMREMGCSGAQNLLRLMAGEAIQTYTELQLALIIRNSTLLRHLSDNIW